METPSSTRRVNRSQALATANNSNNIPMSRKTEESEKGFSKSRQRNGKQQDRSVLIDITNDSPIVGLAMGSLETPSSRMSKKRNNTTPGSGEALLRSQVKTLLQKVEEEAEFFTKLSFEQRSLLHLHQQGLLNSPIGLLAPTPANTPDVPDLSGYEQLALAMPYTVQEKFNLSQMVSEVLFDGMKEKGLESEKNLISRPLLLDFSEKSERFDSSGCSSVVVTCEGGESGGSKEKSMTDDDDASVWSIQVNASTRDEEEEEDEEENDDDDVIEEEVAEEDEEDYDGDQEEEEDNNGGLVDELCEGMRNISVMGEKKMVKFSGKHTRFVYNSDDELEGEEECVGRGESEASPLSPGILRLKGLPTPKGKHLRFHEEDIEEEA